ncbi:hypothetical protein E4T56_gene13733 [Termitomyces sp. T112]|nr:hypothetical protein E4T56_gene13733 [Termitomyces sp. T112]
MHHLPSRKQLISAPEFTAVQDIVVHLYDDPDSTLNNLETWYVYPHSNNVFKQELWDVGYIWCSDSNGSNLSLTREAKRRSLSSSILFPMLLKPLKHHTWPRESPDLFSLDFPLPGE